MPLAVELVSADRLVWSGEASFVVARTAEGDMGVLPGHAPVLAVLSEGELRISPTSGDAVVAQLDSGFLSVDHDRVTVVSSSAELASGSQSR